MKKIDSSSWNMSIGYLPHSQNVEGPVDRRRGGRITKELQRYGFNISYYNPINDQNDYDIIIISGLYNIDNIIIDLKSRKNTYFILDQPDALLLSAGPHLRFISRIMRNIRELKMKLFNPNIYLRKIVELATVSDAIITNSTMQADVLLKYNKNVTAIPDILDEEYGGQLKKATQNNICRLVWEGFSENVLHFNSIRKALEILSAKYSIELLVYCNENIPKYFKHAGSVKKYLSTLPCRTIFCPWNKETCANDLLKGDIGVIPIDMRNKFASAKPANKLNIMRMLGLPVVATPTQAHKEAIHDGIDGFIASNTKEWVEKIGRLIDDINLRESVGIVGREKAFKNSSFSMIWPQWRSVFLSLQGKKQISIDI